MLSVSAPEYSEYFCLALTQSNLKRYTALFRFEGIFKERKIRLIHLPRENQVCPVSALGRFQHPGNEELRNFT